MKTICIVIPVFNEGDAIANNLSVIFEHLEAIQGLSKQVLLVDDGSTDNTVAVLEKLRDRYDSLR